MSTRTGVPSAVSGCTWPDNFGLSGRPASTKPLKTDAERADDARKKWGSTLKGKALPDGTVKVSTFGPAGAQVPKIWGNGLGAVDARAHGAELTGKGIVFPDSSSGPGVVPSVVLAPDAQHDRRWLPPEAHPEDRWGRTSPLIAAATAGGRKMVRAEGKPDGKLVPVSDDALRGLYKARVLYRTTPIVGSVALPTSVDKALPAGKVSVGRTGKVVSARKARDLAALSVKGTVGVSDIEAARVKREARGMILCDARKAPPRQIVAF